MIAMLAGLFAKKAVGGFLAKYWKWVMLAIVVGLVTFAINRMVNNYEAAVRKAAQLEQTLLFEREEKDRLTQEYDTYKENVAVSVTRANENIAALRRKSIKNRAEVDRLGELYEKHDFAYLVQRKPGLVARRATAATNRLFSDLENHTRKFSAGGAAGDIPETPSP